jgi:hypothetical protein
MISVSASLHKHLVYGLFFLVILDFGFKQAIAAQYSPWNCDWRWGEIKLRSLEPFVRRNV